MTFETGLWRKKHRNNDFSSSPNGLADLRSVVNSPVGRSSLVGELWQTDLNGVTVLLLDEMHKL